MATIILSKCGIVLQRIPLTKDRISIGRRTYNDVVIDDADVSAEHAAIILTSAGTFFEDLNSTNGSLLNGMAATKSVLADRDLITLGAHRLQYCEDSGPTFSIDHARAAAPLSSWSVDGADLDSAPNAAFASLHFLNGPNVGKQFLLDQPLTTLGKPDIHIAVIARTRHGYGIRHIYGGIEPLVDGFQLNGETRFLTDGDVIGLSRFRLLFKN